MEVNKYDILDEVKQYSGRNENLLAELRRKTVVEIQDIKMRIKEDGVVIGISPPDSLLNQHTRGEITNLIRIFFNRMRERREDGALCPIFPLSLYLVGEYSPKHRWHYHGIIKVNNILVLDKIKRRCQKLFGRTITEQMNNSVNYINYMFKQYECPEHGTYYPWQKEECYIHVEH